MRHRAALPEAAPAQWPALIPPDSFHARLAEYRDALVSDDDYTSLYEDSRKGQLSIPPSLVVLAMLLQFHDDCSDREAEIRLRFDLRWKRALGLDLEDTGFDATALCRFRRKLLDRGLEPGTLRVLFERLVCAARDAGLLAKGAEQLTDGSHVLGAAGVPGTRAAGVVRAHPGRHPNAGAGAGVHPGAPRRATRDGACYPQRNRHDRSAP